jgi:phosphoglycolate phosphatase-like HAD superfamily hydrolase
MRTLLATSIAVWSALLAALPATAQTDPLPSWNEGAAKQTIVKFVEDATREGGTGFVPAAERIAVFDNDGTLWSEQPVYFQMAFAIDQVKLMAPKHPEWTTEEPFKSLIAGDVKGALGQGEKAILQMMAATHTGMTTDEFSHTVSQWAATAKHPRSGKLYTEMVFQPMLEVLTYLRANGFKTYIVSGGGIEFMRPWVEKVYGIPPEQVVGSSGVTKFDLRSTGPVLLKDAKMEFIDDGPGKPVGINRFIGRRPVLAFGNSDGDQQMLQWTAGGSHRRFMGIVHHTDAKREWAYDRQSQIGKLDKALDEAKAKGWTVVDMQKDWKRIYPYDK